MRCLFVPSTLKGNGTGHIARCFFYARQLLMLSKKHEVALYIPDLGKDYRTADEIKLAYVRECELIPVLTMLTPEDYWDYCVLDKRNTSIHELRLFEQHGNVILLDESGASAALGGYIVNMLHLPRCRQGGLVKSRNCSTLANINDVGLLPLPPSRRAFPDKIESLLIAFGGEDAAALTEKCLKRIKALYFLSSIKITVLTGAFKNFDNDESYPGVRFLSAIPDLREQIHTWDCVITHYGLTAYEARAAGCAVLLAHPSAEHERLARAGGFLSFGSVFASTQKIHKFAQNPASMIKPETARIEQKSLAENIENLKWQHASYCKSCGSYSCHAVYRDRRKSYFSCEQCGLVRLSYFDEQIIKYSDRAYFFEEYKEQYGRTYLEDMDNLRSFGRQRLKRIEALMPSKGKILDIGCAYGAFLKEASDSGWNAAGVDVSQAAVDYVRTTWKIPAVSADFTATRLDGFVPRDNDCVTLWYVIEHFETIGLVLSRINSILRIGGILAFSTPSGSGVSARCSKDDFYKNSPDDHWTIWNPLTVEKVLARYGFEVRKKVITGHHPERFPFAQDKPGSFGFKTLKVVSKVFGLGDTFECYAVKVRNTDFADSQ